MMIEKLYKRLGTDKFQTLSKLVFWAAWAEKDKSLNKQPLPGCVKALEWCESHQDLWQKIGVGWRELAEEIPDFELDQLWEDCMRGYLEDSGGTEEY